MSIFYADDDDDEIMLFRDALAMIDHSLELITAADGREALNYLKNFKLPKVIFLDQHMPYKTGLEVLIEIKQIARLQHVPVIIYSNRPDDDILLAALHAGACKFLPKNISLQEFIGEMKGILRSVKLIQ